MSGTELNRAERVLIRILDAVTTPAWIVFLVVSVGQVLARYVFNVPFLWAEELARFTLIWFCFLGSVQLVLLNDNIDIDFVVKRSGPRWQRAFWVIKELAILATGVMLLWGTVGLMNMSRATSPATGLPISWWYAAGAAAGAGFMVISALRLLAWTASFTRKVRS